MLENELKAKLKSGDLSGCYIFTGEEEYLKNYYCRAFKKAAISDETFITFNYSLFDGPEVDYGAIVDAIKSPPMFDKYKLIEWRYPDFTKMKEKEVEALDKCIDLVKENDYAILIFNVEPDGVELGYKNRPSTFVKHFSKTTNMVNFDTVDEKALLNWLKRHFESENVKPSLDALKQLIFMSGHSMTVLNLECKKLAEYVKAVGRVELSVEDVELIASKTPESDAFALSNAIMHKSKKEAYNALYELKFRRVEPQIIMGSIGTIFQDLLKIAVLMEEGANLEVLESETKMKGYRLNLYTQGAKKYGAKRLKKIVNELTRVDSSSKFGGITGYTAIELFLGNCL